MKPFRQPSVMNAQTHFSNIPSADIPRSTFDRSHAYKTTFDAGKCIPFFWDEVLPGDTFHIKANSFARLATPLKPFMDNVFLDTHFFFVPNRQVWDNWQKFMGEREDPDDDPAIYTVPQVKVDLANISGSVADYFGLPQIFSPGVPKVFYVNALPFRAYMAIWNEWYRDENLQDTLKFDHGDAPGASVIGFMPLPRNKRKDYFTSCLPWPQKGDEVVIPLGNFAPIRGLGVAVGSPSYASNIVIFNESNGETAGYDTSWATDPAVGNGGGFNVQEDPNNPGFPLVWADLTEATAVSINDLRTAFQIQRLLERDARGGTRYIEIILSHFGVRSDDLRLQRPEYLGGDTTRINVNPIASTFANAEVPQGQLAGVGTAFGSGGFSKSFTEHGYVIGIVSARADLTYQNGIDRMWSRKTRYDFYWPAFAHLGEQAVLAKEIYVPVDEDAVFGYQERYAEYRFKLSRVTGLFASNNPESLDYWHLSEDFETLPVLNGDFIQENPPIDRVIAVPDEPHFLLDVWFDYKCQRPMPVYSVPGLVDHF